MNKNIIKKLGKTRIRLLITSGILFFIFTILSYAVAIELLDQWDFDMTVKLQDNVPARFDDEFSSLSLLGSFDVSTVVFCILVFFIGKTWWQRFFMSITYPVFHVIEVIGKLYIDKVGTPFMFHRYAFDFHFPSSYVLTDTFSYPSGHVGRTAMLITLGVYMVITRIRNKWIRYGLIGTQLSYWGVMVVSRVVLGEHWTSDTIGGTLLGVSMALLALAI